MPASHTSGGREWRGVAPGRGTRPPEDLHPVFQDTHHAVRTTHYGSLPQKAQHGRAQDENPVVHFFKSIVSGRCGVGGGRGVRGAPRSTLGVGSVSQMLWGDKVGRGALSLPCAMRDDRDTQTSLRPLECAAAANLVVVTRLRQRFPREPGSHARP